MGIISFSDMFGQEREVPDAREIHIFQTLNGYNIVVRAAKEEKTVERTFSAVTLPQLLGIVEAYYNGEQ